MNIHLDYIFILKGICLLWLVNTSLYGQEIESKLSSTKWYTEEGVMLEFTDSTISFPPFGKIHMLDMQIEWEDSVIYTKERFKSKNNQRIKIATIDYYHIDSIIVNFILRWENNGDSSNNNILNIEYYSFINSSKITFYSENEYKKRKTNYKLYYFATSAFNVDSAGNILLSTNSIVKLNGTKYIDGIHKGKFSKLTFKKFKEYIVDSLIVKSTFQQNECCITHGGSKHTYLYRTKNLKPQNKKSLFGKPHEPKLDLDDYLFSDSAWRANKMKFYGYDKNNNTPLKKQQVFKTDIPPIELYSAQAYSGRIELEKKVSNKNTSEYIYKLLIDSIFDNPANYKYYPEVDSLFFVSKKELDSLNDKGVIVKPVQIFNELPLIHIRGKANTYTYFYELIERFILNKYSYIFLFNRSYGTRSRFEIRASEFESPLNLKISREILKLQDLYYY